MTPTEAITEMLDNGDYDSLKVERGRSQFFVHLRTYDPDFSDLTTWDATLDKAISNLHREWRTLKERKDDRRL